MDILKTLIWIKSILLNDGIFWNNLTYIGGLIYSLLSI